MIWPGRRHVEEELARARATKMHNFNILPTLRPTKHANFQPILNLVHKVWVSERFSLVQCLNI